MDTPQATARIAGHPLHPLLVTLPIGSWVLALVCDVVYWRGGHAMPLGTETVGPKSNV